MWYNAIMKFAVTTFLALAIAIAVPLCLSSVMTSMDGMGSVNGHMHDNAQDQIPMHMSHVQELTSSAGSILAGVMSLLALIAFSLVFLFFRAVRLVDLAVERQRGVPWRDWVLPSRWGQKILRWYSLLQHSAPTAISA